VAVASAAPAAVDAEDVVYCAHVVDRNEMTECAVPIDAETARHREGSWILRRRGGRPFRVEHVNGSGQLTNVLGDHAAWDLTFTGNRLHEEKISSATGQLVETIVHAEGGGRVDFRDAKGRPHLRDEMSYAATLVETDSRGLTTSRRFLDATGAPTTNRSGAHEERYRVDDRGIVLETALFDAARRPMFGKEHFHRLTAEVDAQGNRLVHRPFDVAGEPVTINGGREIRQTFDAWGNQIELRWVDVDGNPVTGSAGWARWAARYDEHGNRIETSYFAADGRPGTGPDGASIVRSRFDERGRVVQVARFDPDGRPSTRRAPIEQIRYDERGRAVERSFLDAAGALRTDRYARQRDRYDEHDNLIEEAYFDAWGEPADPGLGAFGYTISYDAQDRPSEKAFFGANKALVAVHAGYAVIRYSYAASGKALPEEHRGIDGAPMNTFGAKHLMVMYQGARRAAAGITRTRADARARAEEARQKINAGMSFEDAVRLYSDEPGAAQRGGDLGSFPRTSMVPEFQRALEALPVGDVSDTPVETPFGFHIILRTR
jgi:hypothetical protein